MIPEPCLATSKLFDNMDHVLQCMIIVLFFFFKNIFTQLLSLRRKVKKSRYLTKHDCVAYLE